jgi:hypothetical protein
VTIHHIFAIDDADPSAKAKYDSLFPKSYYLTSAPTTGPPTRAPTFAPTQPTLQPTSIDELDMMVPTPAPKVATPAVAPTPLTPTVAPTVSPCQYSTWSEWSDCSAPCISGTQERKRKLLKSSGAKHCSESTDEIRNCNMGVSCGQCCPPHLGSDPHIFIFSLLCSQRTRSHPRRMPSFN